MDNFDRGEFDGDKFGRVKFDLGKKTDRDDCGTENFGTTQRQIRLISG